MSGVGLAKLRGLPRLASDWTSVIPRPRAAELGAVACLPRLRVLNLPYANITDGDISQIGGLPCLQSLDLSFTTVKGLELKPLPGWNTLLGVNDCGTGATDAGSRHVVGLTPLRHLHPSVSKFTDVGLERLRGLGALRMLNLSGTGTTHEGVAKLHRATCRSAGLLWVRARSSSPRKNKGDGRILLMRIGGFGKIVPCHEPHESRTGGMLFHVLNRDAKRG